LLLRYDFGVSGQPSKPAEWSIGEDEPAGISRSAYTSDHPTFGINIGEHLNAVEVYTSAEDRDLILLAVAYLKQMTAPLTDLERGRIASIQDLPVIVIESGQAAARKDYECSNSTK
jgi:hypothetical protein